MLLPIALLVLAVALSPDAPANAQPDPDDLALVKEELARLQYLSFATEREYCGYLGETRDGLTVTPVVRGGHDGCTPVLPDSEMRLIASFHTHGAYDPDVPAEFPTAQDLLSDAQEGVDGYVATPGGRLWFIDGAAGHAVQICGLNCLPQDPDFHAGDDGVIRQSYRLRDLLRMENSH